MWFKCQVIEILQLDFILAERGELCKQSVMFGDPSSAQALLLRGQVVLVPVEPALKVSTSLTRRLDAGQEGLQEGISSVVHIHGGEGGAILRGILGTRGGVDQEAKAGEKEIRQLEDHTHFNKHNNHINICLNNDQSAHFCVRTHANT